MAASAAVAAMCTLTLAVLADAISWLGAAVLTGCFSPASTRPGRLQADGLVGEQQQPRAGHGSAHRRTHLGSTLPHLIGGLVTLSWRRVLQVTSAVGLLGAVPAVVAVRPGPHLSTGPVT